MSGSQTRTDVPSTLPNGKDRDLQGQSLRFTPLRSHVLRARALKKETRGELALSRLIPTPRPQT
ncbi:MAG TPA: hypothetical protein VMW57_01030 [Methyloceanibacter sp.]|nr:hypothetical protein [Methyloceanibacter sp.]